MFDQFYWAERMFWLGVAPEPLKRSHLIPEESDDKSIQEAANLLSRVINDALSSEIRERAVDISKRISHEVILVGGFQEDQTCLPCTDLDLWIIIICIIDHCLSSKLLLHWDLQK